MFNGTGNSSSEARVLATRSNFLFHPARTKRPFTFCFLRWQEIIPSKEPNCVILWNGVSCYHLILIWWQIVLSESSLKTNTLMKKNQCFMTHLRKNGRQFKPMIHKREGGGGMYRNIKNNIPAENFNWIKSAEKYQYHFAKQCNIQRRS